MRPYNFLQRVAVPQHLPRLIATLEAPKTTSQTFERGLTRTRGALRQEICAYGTSRTDDCGRPRAITARRGPIRADTVCSGRVGALAMQSNALGRHRQARRAGIGNDCPGRPVD